MPLPLSAFLLGVIAGLRSATPAAALAWGASFGWLPIAGTWAGLLAHPFARYLLGVAAAGEWIGDKLPTTPSRKAPGPFVGRVLSGALCGAVLATPGGMTVVGAVAGAAGAVAGTLGGYEARTRLARTVGRDLPVALVEDVIAVAGALAIVAAAY
jgi:uncharacterized membrane protein